MPEPSLPLKFKNSPPHFFFFSFLHLCNFNTRHLVFGRVVKSASLARVTLTSLFTHNMGLHVRRKACLCKTMDRSLGQWAPVVEISSYSPWKPAFFSESKGTGGGVWIEVASRALLLAGVPEPEQAGVEPTDYCVSQSEARLHWGIRDDFKSMYYSIFDFTFARHAGLSDRWFSLHAEQVRFRFNSHS